MEPVGNGQEVCSWAEARDTLRHWREEDLRRGSRVVQLGRYLLKEKLSQLGSEVWAVYEQTCIAALDCGDLLLAKDCIRSLSKQFPNSLRVSKLNGLYLEAEGKYVEASELYTELLKEHPSSSSLWKRKVAILKAQGKVMEAIKELSELLLVFMTDSEAWLELADMYIGINELGRAAFCMEELILSNPHHYLYHLKYAEICYSIERIELAKKHYATAVKLNPSNLRALYGLYLVSQLLGSKGRQVDSKSKHYQYIEWTKVQIKRCYQFDDHKLRIVEKTLEK